MTERVIRPAEGPGRATVRASLRGRRLRHELTGGFDTAGALKEHNSPYTKPPLHMRKARRRAQRKAA